MAVFLYHFMIIFNIITKKREKKATEKDKYTLLLLYQRYCHKTFDLIQLQMPWVNKKQS